MIAYFHLFTRLIIRLTLSAVILFTPALTSAEVQCLDATGEAAIMKADVTSARLEAIARARWSAVEQALGVQVRAQSLVQDMKLVDDVISSRVSGFITATKVLSENSADNLLTVRINACVEPRKASDAISALALNRSLSVFLPARKPRVVDEGETVTSSEGAKSRKTSFRTVDEQDDTNFFSETLIGRLAETGYTVTDLAPTHLVDAAALDKALKSGNFLTMRSVLYKTLSNVMLLGKIDYTISQKKGDDIGYGADYPFNRVTVRLTYRLVTRAPESNQLVILGTGTAESLGVDVSLEDATSKGLKGLVAKTIPSIMEKLARHIKGVTKTISIRFTGEIGSVDKTIDLRRYLSGLSWVTDVESTSLNEFTVKYPEDTLYLANSLNRDRRFKVVEFAPDRLVVSYQDPK